MELEEEEGEEQTPPGTPFDYGHTQTAARDSAAISIPTANFFTPQSTDSQATCGSDHAAAGTGRRSPSPIRTRNEAIQARRHAEVIPVNIQKRPRQLLPRPPLRIRRPRQHPRDPGIPRLMQ